MTIGLAASIHLGLAAATLQAAPDRIIVTLPKGAGGGPRGAGSLPDRPGETWSREPVAEAADRLRKRLGLKVPASAPRLVAYRSAVHHSSVQWSVVAWRDADGRWTVERGGEEGGGLLEMERRVWKTETWALPAATGEALDRLLGEPSIFDEPPLGEEPAVGGLNSSLEIVSPSGRRSICWSGKLMGILGQVADTVLDPP